MTGLKLLSAADTFSKSGYPDLASDAELGERLAYGLKVALIGMAVVFLVLIILWVVLAIFKVIFARDKKAVEANDTNTAAPAKSSTSAPSGTEEEIVAIATAAIAAARGESDCAFNIISITKIEK